MEQRLSWFDRLLAFLLPSEPAAGRPSAPPSLAEIMAMTAIPEAGSGVWFR